MTRAEYAAWWDENTDSDGELRALDEPNATLAAHVMALQERIEKLTHPDEHDASHGRACRCMNVFCCCAYDHPDAICMDHKGKSDIGSNSESKEA